MATEYGTCSIVSIIHNAHYPKNTPRQLEIAQPLPWSIYSNAESSKTYVRMFFAE
jgi:hypothetical protein